MKQWSLLLKLSCIVLLVSTCNSQSVMTKKDFSEQGVSIVLSDEPSYRSEIAKLGFADSMVAQLPAASIIVKNSSRRPIVAFAVRFTKRLAGGQTATSDIVDSQPSALLDKGEPGRYDKPPGALIMPDNAVVVTPDGVFDPSRKGFTRYSTYSPSTILKVELDSAVFNDGEAMGPDRIGAIQSLKAHIDAQQDLMEEISARLSRGEPLRNILQDLQSVAASQRPSETLTPADPAQIYAVVRGQYLNELSATEANAGEEIAIRRLRQLRYATRPTINKRTGGQ